MTPRRPTSRTLPADAFAKRAGVCQDFAHVMIAGLRTIGLPAAYVSGFLRTEPPPGQPRLEGADATHAWVAVWCGREAGWIGLDPTNGVAAAGGPRRARARVATMPTPRLRTASSSPPATIRSMSRSTSFRSRRDVRAPQFGGTITKPARQAGISRPHTVSGRQNFSCQPGRSARFRVRAAASAAAERCSASPTRDPFKIGLRDRHVFHVRHRCRCYLRNQRDSA